MVVALSRSEFPSGGWQFFQPQMDWSAPNPIGNTFGQQVTEIIKMRMKNPAIVAKFNMCLDEVCVGNELEAYTRTRLKMPDIHQAPAVVAAGTGQRGGCCGG